MMDPALKGLKFSWTMACPQKSVIEGQEKSKQSQGNLREKNNIGVGQGKLPWAAAPWTDAEVKRRVLPG